MHEKKFRVVGLGLELDHGRHRVTRGNRPPVDFHGNCRQWTLLSELAKRHEFSLEKRELIAVVWTDEMIPEEKTVWAAISELRSRLRPLGITIKFTKGLGYRLDKR